MEEGSVNQKMVVEGSGKSKAWGHTQKTDLCGCLSACHNFQCVIRILAKVFFPGYYYYYFFFFYICNSFLRTPLNKYLYFWLYDTICCLLLLNCVFFSPIKLLPQLIISQFVVKLIGKRLSNCPIGWSMEV